MSQPPNQPAPVFGHQRAANLAAKDASGTSYILIQSNGLLAPDNQAELRKQGVEFLEYLRDSIYLCRYIPDDLGVIRGKTYVKHVDVYRPQFKIHARTQQSRSAFNLGSSPASLSVNPKQPGEKLSVAIMLHKKLGKSADQIVQELVTKGLVDKAETKTTDTQISTRIDSAKLAALAENDNVRSIEPEKEMLFRDDRARNILNAEAYRGEYTGADGKFTGKDQIITVVDSGFDLGTTGPGLHKAFSKERILALYRGAKEKSLTGDEAELKDVSGHGTHCAGCAAGGPIRPLPNGPIMSGTAPEANLIIVVKDNEKGSSDRYLRGPHEKGARLFSISWGPEYSGEQFSYDSNATAIDEFVDANKTSLFCWAAGNDGTKSMERSIISQAAAKNVLTVGNSNSERPDAHTQVKFILGDEPAANPYLVDVSSSRGPTAEQMLKPDVVAPGMRIFAARSQARKDIDSKDIDPNADRSSELMSMSGTSHATPHAAGCVALLRQALKERNNIVHPTAALLRALIVNGAVWMTPTKREQWDKEQGFGRLNVAASLAHLSAPAGFAQFEDVEVTMGQTHSTKVKVPPASYVPRPGEERRWHLRVTLIYTDSAGEGAQNHMLLHVLAGGETRYGNLAVPKKGQLQEKPGLEGINNVQRLDWYGVPAGEASINIFYGHQVQPHPSWPCALVWFLD